ncbi:MAG: ABC transporter permease [Geminicoccaceae bacterium]
MSIVRRLFWRLASSLIVLIGVSMLIFFIARIIPGDPARIALGPRATEAQVEQMRDALNLNEPIVVQYGLFMRDLMHGDLGISLYSKRPVMTDLAEYLPATLELVLLAGLMMVALGLPLGAISARYRRRWPDNLVRVMALMTVSAPAFVWAVGLVLLFAYFMPLFPITGRISDTLNIPPLTGFLLVDTLAAGRFDGFLSALHHLILPAFALSLSGIGQAARLTRANMITTYEQPAIEMAEAYGFPERRIARLYAFKPSLIPSLTIIGLDFAALLGNAFLVEVIFAWPGLSRYGVGVILQKDLNAIVGTVLIISATFLIANIIVDFLVSLLNPRIRLSEGGE